MADTFTCSPSQGKWYNIGFAGGQKTGDQPSQQPYYLDAKTVMPTNVQEFNATGVSRPQFSQQGFLMPPQQLWQFWPTDKPGVYLVRSAGAGTNMFLSAFDAPTIKNPQRYPNDQSMLWKVSGANSVYCTMTNQGNGTSKLAAATKANNGAFLDTDSDTTDQNRIYLREAGTADWWGFQNLDTSAVLKGNADSSLSISGSASAATVTTTVTATQSASADANTGLSAGASAGITFIVTLLVCSAAFVGAWMMLRRNFQKQLQSRALSNEAPAVATNKQGFHTSVAQLDSSPASSELWGHPPGYGAQKAHELGTDI